MPGRFWKLLLLIALCLLLTGCTEKKTDAGTVVCCYQWWVGFAGVGAGIVATLFTWLTTKQCARYFYFPVALVGTVTYAPFGFFDHVTVTPERLQTRWGFWCLPTTHDIAFADITSVNMTKKTTRRRRRGNSTSYFYKFLLRDGTVESVPAKNTLMNEADDALTSRLAEHGLKVQDHTDE